MGLAISTGVLADLMVHDEEGAEWIREELQKVYAILKEEGLPGFTEPETFAPSLVPPDNSFSYSFLHYLRRAYARQREGLPLIPAGDELSPTDTSLIDDWLTMFDSHLLVHSDADGFYVPIDFPNPISGDDMPGAMLGSSYGLLRELVHLAPFLGIDLTETGELTEQARQELEREDNPTPYWREYMVWYTLYRAARFSIANTTMIVFM